VGTSRTAVQLNGAIGPPRARVQREGDRHAAFLLVGVLNGDRYKKSVMETETRATDTNAGAVENEMRPFGMGQ
jgi:hypothetical protein